MTSPSIFALSPASERLFARAQRVLPGGNTRTTVFMRPFPLYAVRGAGARVWDADGVVRIDCINNFTAMIHGHAHPEIGAAVIEQLANGTAFGMPTESEILLAEILAERVESVERVRFMNSGTEAVMMSIKAARAFTGRAKIAKCEGAYHGSYDHAEVSLDSTPDNWKDPSHCASVPYAAGTPQAVLDDTLILPFNDIDASVEIIRANGAALAGIVVDPIPNRAGLVPATKAYLEAIRSAATEVGALLIFDEVISFRLAYRGAQSLWNVAPDLTVFGKIIGGGFPVGAVGGRADVMDVFNPVLGKPKLPHGGTFSANPITMVAGAVAMRLLTKASHARLDRIGETVRAGIDESFKRRGLAGHTTGLGSLLKVHFTDAAVRDYRSAYQDARQAKLASAFHLALLERGVLAAPYGLVALSTAMTDGDVAQIVSAADDAIANLAKSERH